MNIACITSAGRDVQHLHVRTEFILLFLLLFLRKQGGIEREGKIGEVRWAREMGCQFLFNSPLAVFVLFWTAF